MTIKNSSSDSPRFLSVKSKRARMGSFDSNGGDGESRTAVACSRSHCGRWPCVHGQALQRTCISSVFADARQSLYRIRFASTTLVRLSSISINKNKNGRKAVVVFMVEMARVELASKSISAGTSPSAVNDLKIRLGRRPLTSFSFI